MAVVFSVTLELPSAHGAIKGLIDPVANFRAAVHRDWLESPSAGASIALENLAGYARGNLIYGAGSDWAPLTIDANGYILGSDGTDVLWSSVHLDEHAPTGFPNRTDTSISFDDGTRTLTLAKTGASFDVYVKGVKYTYTENQTKQITDTEGTWWFYIDSAGALDAAQTAPNLRDTAWVAIVYWNATGNVALDIAEERHGMTMDGSTHSLMHFTVGTRFESGLPAGDYTTAGDGSAEADAQLSIGDGRIADEDLAVTITDDSPQNLAPIAYIPVYYLDGAAPVWRKTVADVFPLFDNATDEISYNLDTAGTWSQPAATNNYFVAMWIFASTNTVEPVIAILGQRQDSKLNDAQDNNTYEALTFDTLPFQEMKIIYRLIFQTRYPQYANTPHAKLVDIVDLRTVSNLPSGTYVATAHSSLTGRDARNSHPASAIRVDLTNMGFLLSGLVLDTTDDVQAALEVLDDILENAQTVNADWTWGTTSAIHFRDAAIHIASLNDTFLDLTADGAIRLNADMLSPLSAKHYFDAGAAAGGEWIESPADTIGRMVAEAYWQVGDGVPTHIAGAPNSFHVSGRLEVDGVAHFDNYLKTYTQVEHALNANVLLGGTSWPGFTARSPGGETDSLICRLGDTDRAIIFISGGFQSRDFDHGAQAYPTAFFQSVTDPNTNNTQWGSVGHDTVDFVYDLGSGVHKFTGDMLSHGSAKHYFDAGAAIGTEYITSGADTYLDAHFAAGARFYTAAPDLLLTIGSLAGFPTYTVLNAPVYLQLQEGGVAHVTYINGVAYHVAHFKQTDKYIWLDAVGATNAFYLGKAAEARVYYDSTNLQIRPAVGGTGYVNIFKDTDAQSVAMLTLEGDRATFANNDEIYQSWKLSNNAGTQTEFARMVAIATDVSDGTEDGALGFEVMVAGALTEVFRADATFATNWTGLTDAGVTALHSHAAAAPSAHEIASAGGFHTAAGLTIGHVLRASAADAFAFAAIAASDLPIAIDAAKIGDGTVSNAEFELLDDYNTIGLAALTAAEVDQLENIAATTISAAQWVYLGAMDQGVATGDSPVFSSVGMSANEKISSDNANELSLHAGAAGVVSYEDITIDRDTTENAKLILQADTTDYVGILRMTDKDSGHYWDLRMLGTDHATTPDKFWLRAYDGTARQVIVGDIGGGIDYMVMSEDGWIGIDAAAENIEFDGSTDFIKVNNADFHVVDESAWVNKFIAVSDSVHAAPGATAGWAKIFVDVAGGDLKVIFGDGHVATIATDS